MLKRYLSAAVGLVILAVVIYYLDTLMINIVLAILGQIAAYEAVKAFCGKMRLGIFLPCSLFIVANLFFNLQWLFLIMLLIFTLFCGMIMPKEKVSFRDASAVFLITVIVSYGFTSILGLRSLGNTIWDNRMMVIFGLGFGWICDTFAFVFGNIFGNNKLAPKISPNKTIEGAFGGALSTMALSVGIYTLYVNVCGSESIFFARFGLINYLYFAVAGLLGGLIGLVGDLAYSYIKRECGIKDFGKIMPGHGGALDRLDSVLFSSAFALFAFSVFFNYM